MLNMMQILLTMLGEVLAALDIFEVDEDDFLASIDFLAQVTIVGQRDALLARCADRRLQSLDGIFDGGEISFLLDFPQVLEARLSLEFTLAQILHRQAVLDKHNRQRFLVRLRLHHCHEFIATEMIQRWQEARPAMW